MNKYQRRYCNNVLNSMMKNSFFAIFLDPITDDYAPGYSDVIEKPMCLTQVKSMLDSKKIDTVDKFKSTVKLIWKNCVKYNQKVNPEYVYYARVGHDYFHRKMEKIVESETEDTIRKITKCAKKIRKYSEKLEKAEKKK